QHRWLLESTLLRMMPAQLAAASHSTTAPAVAQQPAQPRRETVASTPTVIPRPHFHDHQADSAAADGAAESDISAGHSHVGSIDPTPQRTAPPPRDQSESLPPQPAPLSEDRRSPL